MPRIGMLIVKVAVQIPERTMKSAVLATAVEAVLVRALVDFRRAIVEAVMSVMIAGVVIMVVARRCWRPWQREPQDAGQQSRLVHCSFSFALSAKGSVLKVS